MQRTSYPTLGADEVIESLFPSLKNSNQAHFIRSEDSFFTPGPKGNSRFQISSENERIWQRFRNKQELMQSNPKTRLLAQTMPATSSDELKSMVQLPIKRRQSLSDVWAHSWDMSSLFSSFQTRERAIRVSLQDDEEEETTRSEFSPQDSSDDLTLTPRDGKRTLSRGEAKFGLKDTISLLRDNQISWSISDEENLGKLILSNDKKEILGGTPEMLVTALLRMKSLDGNFFSDFLYTYRTFMAPSDFLLQLTSAFKSDQGLLGKFPIRARVLNIIVSWLTYHYYDLINDSSVTDGLITFLDSIDDKNLQQTIYVIKGIIQEKEPSPKFKLDFNSRLEIIEGSLKRIDCKLTKYNVKKGKYYYKCYKGGEFVTWLLQALSLPNRAAGVHIANNMLKNNILKVVNKSKTEKVMLMMKSFDEIKAAFRGAPDEKGSFVDDDSVYYRYRGEVSTSTTPKPIVPNDLPSLPQFHHLDCCEVARQLTLISESVYEKITLNEFSDLKWWEQPKSWKNGEKSSNLMKFVNRTNSLTNWVQTEIVTCATEKERAKIIGRFLDVCKELEKLSNFNDLVAIMAGLFSHPVRRLKRTWKIVPAIKVKLLDDLERKYSPANQKALREAHEKVKAPCIPVLVQFVGDLIRLRENPDKLDDKNINFSKCRVTAKIFRQLNTFKTEKYQLKPILEYQKYLTEGFYVLDDNELIIKNSLTIEPKLSREY